MIKIRRNFKRSGGKPQGTKGAKKQRNLCSCENFGSQKNPLRKEASPTKSFRNQKDHAAKLGFCYETSTPLRNHFSATSPPLAKFFATAKHLSGTLMPFHSPQPHFAAAKWPTKFPFCCEIPLCLRNGPLRTKIPIVF